MAAGGSLPPHSTHEFWRRDGSGSCCGRRAPVLGVGGWVLRVVGEVEVMVDVKSAEPSKVNAWSLIGLVQGALLLGETVTPERWNEFVGMAGRE